MLWRSVVEECYREVLVIVAQTRNADKCTVVWVWTFSPLLHFYCQVILPCLQPSTISNNEKNAEKIDTNAQWFHCSWSILLKRVNIRVRGFHLVFSDVPKTTVSQWLIYLVVWGSWWWFKFGIFGIPQTWNGRYSLWGSFRPIHHRFSGSTTWRFFPHGKAVEVEVFNAKSSFGSFGEPTRGGSSLGGPGDVVVFVFEKKVGPKKTPVFLGWNKYLPYSTSIGGEICMWFLAQWKPPVI